MANRIVIQIHQEIEPGSETTFDWASKGRSTTVSPRVFDFVDIGEKSITLEQLTDVLTAALDDAEDKARSNG